MQQPSNSLEPLADYLRPRFGSIYDYNFRTVGQFDVQDWTDELKEAVEHYLIYEVPEELRAPLGTRLRLRRASKKDAKDIIAIYQPWEIANIFRDASVIALPSLDALIGHSRRWPSETERWDADTWLEAHSSGDQLSQVAAVSGHRELLQPARINLAFGLVHALQPPALLAAWKEVAEPGRPRHGWPAHEVRSWALAQGHRVGKRGRLPSDVVQKYEHARKYGESS